MAQLLLYADGELAMKIAAEKLRSNGSTALVAFTGTRTDRSRLKSSKWRILPPIQAGESHLRALAMSRRKSSTEISTASQPSEF